MLLKVLGGTNAERRYTGGLSRSGASPYQHLEDDDEYEDEITYSSVDALMDPISSLVDTSPWNLHLIRLDLR
jgi:hypothetical protein